MDSLCKTLLPPCVMPLPRPLPMVTPTSAHSPTSAMALLTLCANTLMGIAGWLQICSMALALMANGPVILMATLRGLSVQVFMAHVSVVATMMVIITITKPPSRTLIPTMASTTNLRNPAQAFARLAGIYPPLPTSALFAHSPALIFFCLAATLAIKRFLVIVHTMK